MQSPERHAGTPEFQEEDEDHDNWVDQGNPLPLRTLPTHDRRYSDKQERNKQPIFNCSDG